MFGTVAAVQVARAGLTLSHWDARAHLVVARRVLDNLVPTWQQIGAVWLPLPHLLNMFPVQVDAWYRSGASAVAISIASMAVGAWAMASMIVRISGSRLAAIAAAIVLLANPNVLYLQSTPMTEPVLFATSMLAVAWTAEWIDGGATGHPIRAGLAIAAASMTRYEAWPIVAVLILLACGVLLRRGASAAATLRAGARLSMWPLIAVVLFALNSKWLTGAWLITGGFFVPENTDALGRPLEAWRQLRVGLYRISGTAVVWTAYAGVALLAIAFLKSSARASLALLLALPAAVALPLYGYVHGHGFRIRYDVPLLYAAAALAGAAIALLPSLLRGVAAVAFVIAALAQTPPPFDRSAPVIAEALRDASNMEARRAVTSYLRTHYDGTLILMSMGSLGHYMHDLSLVGFNIRDFVHEGNGAIWPHALLRARGIAGWVLVEEQAEGGDVLFHRAKRDAKFLEGFERVAEGGGVALYRASRGW